MNAPANSKAASRPPVHNPRRAARMAAVQALYQMLLTGLPADRLHRLLAENAEPIAALVQEKFAQIELDSLSAPEAEQALGKELLQAIGQATGVREELKGIRLEIDAPPASAERLDDLRLERLRALGYVLP